MNPKANDTSSNFWNLYFQINCKLNALFKYYDQKVIGNIITTCLLEPNAAFKASLLMQKDAFQDELTNSHKIIRTPILFLHGLGGDQSLITPLIPTLALLKRPIHTLNTNGCDEEDGLRIQEKIISLSNITGKPIDVIGHSRGARLLSELIEKNSEIAQRIKRLIRLAYPRKISHHTTAYDIVALWDQVFQTDRSNAHKKVVVDTGHLGILFSKQVHWQVYEWLDDSKEYS